MKATLHSHSIALSRSQYTSHTSHLKGHFRRVCVKFRVLNTFSMSGLPKLPDRPRKKQTTASPGINDQVSSSVSFDRPEIDLVRSKMSALAANPAVTRLLENPSLIQDAIHMDPKLGSLLHANPGMADLLRPEKLSQMLQVLISEHSISALLSTETVIGVVC